MLLLMFLTLSLSVVAKPAKPGFFRYVQPDGSVVQIQRHGDEWGHWTTDDKGRVVRREADGFYRPVEGMTPTKAAQNAAIRRKAARQMRSSALSKAPVAMGQKKFVLILVEFSDQAFEVENPHEAFDNMMNQQGYSASGATGSARDFYFDNSHGVFEPVFDVFGPVKLEKEMAYYGKNDESGSDERPEEAVRDAVVMLDEEVDFSQYDLDNDGGVDLVYMIYAGKGEADGGSEDSIWPHQWDLRYGGINLTLDGKKIDFTTDEAVITNSTAVMIAGVAGSQYAIGYVSLGSLNESVKAVKIDGELPSVENINNGSYKISRSFNVAVKENISPVAQDFLDFILSDGGQKIVAGNKYIQVQSKAYNSNMAEGKVVVSGSSSVSPLMEKLIEAYGSVNPNAKIELQTSDSSTGVSNAIAGTCDIGMASRDLKDSEKAKGVKEITIAIDGIAVIVNKANPLENLTKENVEAIFTGKITKWNEVN